MAGNPSNSSSVNQQVVPETTSTCLTQSITGAHNFVITNYSLLEEDCFTIRCVLTVVKTRTEDAATIVVPPSTQHQDFAHMLEAGKGADVNIIVGEQVFRAHKHVLAARSKVFHAQFFGVMTENSPECIEIHDMEPSVFERLLHFIYADTLSEKFEGDKNIAMQHLLVAADRYGLTRLRLMCEEKLCSWIDVQTVGTTLALAEQHQRVQLKEACLGFIALREVLGLVIKTDGYKHLKQSCPTIVDEILEKIASAKIE
ncbi:hypothetical protein PR202_gb14315 [Eleusine coracana subsp. coracana]|uniref:BTB domain-containing protein n=1 Tax=Eleusine coracana subsp. coracana TaxID=191504 RepID=A0AAV5EUC6_ELECO|nr:hypothetical protein PR202_gb14315 [Eleusine coracana subsp. coracana]